ncbi:hypothetical protein GGS23DRAFT_562954 [Durotheca rogersii]|uniref:uncharacterized protein n=1 Tax=Durotheca rogersii TaxID=419775 RepID=UPI00221E713F|nr:uncharacterized protein GGS23DRAFT_562954 [Durotheca rogersii]KAI5864099.1 hypothetical protein GGS23DRAFT_562954 [Durotheca rogersii]
MAVTYGEVPQHDNDDDDRNDGLSPSVSLSPAPSSSPMPFLPTVESTFTRLSMDGDFYSSMGSSAGKGEIAYTGSRDGYKTAAGTATARASVSMSISAMVQSLTSARATRNHPSEYGPLSPDSSPSSTSSSPHPRNRGSTPERNFLRERNTTGGNAHNAPNTSHATHPVPAVELRVKGLRPKDPPAHPYQRDTHQPAIVKPIPIVRTASTKSVSLRHPTPDVNPRSASYASNIAQLEATAEKLSLTSSIEDAIRDLNEEQKRNDSRRSSILAASIGSIPEYTQPPSFTSTKPLSSTSSILEANGAVRHGGYSPGSYFISPNHSLLSNPTRLRSGSGGLTRSEVEAGSVLSRHGPGKSSVRSVRSASKPTLTDIAEMEPTTLTPAAMDAADRLAEEPEEDDALRAPPTKGVDPTPNLGQYGASNVYDYWDQAVADTQPSHEQRGHDRPRSSSSTGTFEQAQMAFANFDGAHCPPDADLEDALFMPPYSNAPSADVSFLQPFDRGLTHEQVAADQSRPLIAPPVEAPAARPTSYMNPETGQTMLYYPARVPMMLNIPQKLSKKPKAEVRNARRSQVLGKMAETNRKSEASFLPEVLLEPPLEPISLGSDAESPAGPASGGPNESPPSREPVADAPRNDPRVSVLGPDKRKSRLPVGNNLPPQLRASAFFELPPSQMPAVELKDGSPMATLDSILDASAKAPVSAFTEHAITGSSGSEIYGTEKKRKSHLAPTKPVEPKKRSSFLHLRKHSALSHNSEPAEDRRNTIAGGAGADDVLKGGNERDEEKQRLSGSIDGRPVSQNGEDDAGDDEEQVYSGPPTTLLAELQMRKQQQKLRTRPLTTAYPNGMHSTLLEMDTVAQIEREARKGRKVNLAWEEPSVDPADDPEDDDTPLGLLMATKGQGNGNGLVAALAEMNRPLGLMEQREMEENEPLSRRRDRLQGKELGPVNRQSIMPLGQGLHNTGSALRLPIPQQPRAHTPEADEVEGETLGERMRRLRAREQGDNPLPRARPVSSAFTTELLTQIGDAFGEGENKEKSDEHPKEEEETLGQRRRRLQAEREAREREMASAMLTGGASGSTAKLTKRRSLADVLGVHGPRNILHNPKAEAERAKREEAARYRQDQDMKLAALRSQMPSNLTKPNLTHSGGFLAGRFNDGTGGGLGQPRASMAMAYPANGMMGGPYNMAMPMPTPGQMDRVERWRQSIQP